MGQAGTRWTKGRGQRLSLRQQATYRDTTSRTVNPLGKRNCMASCTAATEIVYAWRNGEPPQGRTSATQPYGGRAGDRVTKSPAGGANPWCQNGAKPSGQVLQTA
jgi:hypothetical protein